MTEDKTHISSEEPESVDILRITVETFAQIVDAMLALTPPVMDGANLEHQKKAAQLQHGMLQLEAILRALGSDVVKPPEETRPSSGIILPS